MRSSIYKIFKPILNEDKISLKQQLFLEHYVDKQYDNIDRLLLYHGIGTGKTRSSIILAEKIMLNNPEMNAIIILPARLKTNYIDELIPTICDLKYKDELKEYNNINIDEKRKEELYKLFMRYINKKYSIYSYEYIINLFKKSDNLKNTLNTLTKNKILIIDEFHNLIANKISERLLIKLYNKNKLNPATKNIRALIMRYISRYANKTCKMFFLTATPVFDNFNQFVELVKLLNNKDIDNNIETLRDLIPYLIGKVSYYSTINKEDFPKVIIKNLEIPLTETQDKYMYILKDIDNTNEEKDTFLIKQRQLAISAYPIDMSIKNQLKQKNIKLYAPKISILLDNINKQKEGKIVVYSNFIDKGLNIIKRILDNEGWSNYINIKPNFNPYKTYIIWDARLNDTNKQNIKSILNSIDNKDGKIIKLVLGSPSIKEGISFKHIQSLHILDPVWNTSAKEQIEGRCIRYKSHEDIKDSDKPKLKREVIIYNYISVASNKGKITKTCDERIYNEIIPLKQNLVNKMLYILQEIAIDNFLYKELSHSPSNSDSISIKSNDNIYINKTHNINLDYCSSIVAKKMSKISWFSILILCLFYSQYSRLILQKYKPLKPEIFNLFLLKNQPTKKKIMELTKILSIDSISKTQSNPFINNYSSILNLFNIKSLTINKYKNNNHYYYVNDSKNKKDEIPKYIIINLLENENNITKTKLTDYDKMSLFSGLKELDNIIKYKEYNYKLDSCSIHTYDNNKLEYNIAGIICGNTKYIYNSWQQTNPIKNINTELIKYDWNIHNNSPFKYNIETLKLGKKEKEIEISFSKGDRTLIYVLNNNNIDYDSDDSDDNIIIKNKKNTCPKPRRPINNKCINDGYYIKLNNNDNECCYKLRKSKKTK